MKARRCVWALLLAVLFLGSLGISETSAFGPRRGFGGSSGGISYALQGTYPFYSPYAVPGYYPYYNPYMVPLPGYGVMPLPLATMNYRNGYDAYGANYDSSRTLLDAPPRKRPTLYPAVPFERSPAERLTDIRRVRFEITVPFENAIVYFDGVKTKQTGLTRVFMTPPMEEGKEYTVTLDAQWTRDGGKLSAPRPKTFTVVAGERVQHTFID